MRLAGHVARTANKGNSQNMLVERTKDKDQFGSTGIKFRIILKIILKQNVRGYDIYPAGQ